MKRSKVASAPARAPRVRDVDGAAAAPARPIGRTPAAADPTPSASTSRRVMRAAEPLRGGEFFFWVMGRAPGNDEKCPHCCRRCEQPPVLACKLDARLREGVAQTGNHLEQGQIHVGEPRAEEKARLPSAAPENIVEVSEELRHTAFQKIGTAPPRLLALLLKIKTSRYRMMRVVDLDHEVRDGELQLMHTDPCARIARHEAVPRT